MANVDKHAPGSFSWIELATSDQNAAKEFYCPLLGWDFTDAPMGPGEFYTMFHIDGRNVGAAYTMKPEMKAAGVPPHWGVYVATDNADETAAKALAAGGVAIAPPFDVFDFGRMAVLKDPSGAVFSIWQSMAHSGFGITDVPGIFCWADLMTPDQAGAVKFYGEVFGWVIAPGEKDPSGYFHIKNGDKFIGGVPPSNQVPPGVPPHWMSYIFVTDCAASTEKAKELGGKALMGPMEIPNVGHMSVIADPQGATFALFTPNRHN